MRRRRALGVAVVLACVCGLVFTAGGAARVDRAQADTLTVALSPASDTNMVSAEHTVFAFVTDSSSAAVPGATVVFGVTGANDGATCTQPGGNSQITGPDGSAACTYVGTLPGSDTIGADATASDGSTGTADPVSKNWVNPSIDLAPADATNPVGTDHTVTATVSVPSGAGGSISSASVTFSVAGANPQAAQTVPAIDAVATFTYTGTNPGQDTITATVTNVNGVATSGGSATATKTWTSAISVDKTVDSATRTTTTSYAWSAFDKSASPTTLTLKAGDSANVTYTISGTRTPESTVVTYAVSGVITVTNASGADQEVTVVDQAQTTGGSSRGSPVSDTETVARNSSKAIPYTVTFSPGGGDTDSTMYRNHVDVFAGSATSGTPLASVNKPITAVNTTVTVGASASIGDALTCPTGFTCGVPTTFTNQVNDTFGFTYQRAITNTSVCGGSAATVADTATLTPGDGSTHSALMDTASITVTPAACLSVTSLTVTPDHGFVYDWTVSKTVAKSTYTMSQGGAVDISYTVKASRTKTSDTYKVTGQVCVQDASTTVTATGVSAEIFPETTASTRVGTAEAVVSLGTIAPGATICGPYTVTLNVAPPLGGLQMRAKITSTNATSPGQPVESTQAFTMPTNATSTTDRTASVSDAFLSCPTGFACDLSTKVFTFPAAADDPDTTSPSATLYTGSTTYTRHVAQSGTCISRGIINVAKLTESTNASPVRQSTAAALLSPTCTSATTPTTTGTTTTTQTGTNPGPPGSADLAVTTAGKPKTVRTGGSITWTDTVTNNGPSDATNVVLANVFPTNAATLRLAMVEGHCTRKRRTFTCTIPTIASGESAVVTLVVRATAKGKATNVVAVHGTQDDTVRENNKTFASVLVTKPRPKKKR